LPFILLPIKNPFVFSTKKKKERKKEKRVRFAPLSSKGKRHTQDKDYTSLMFRAAAREALRTVSRNHQRGGGKAKNDFRRSMSGGGSIEEERGTCVVVIARDRHPKNHAPIFRCRRFWDLFFVKILFSRSTLSRVLYDASKAPTRK